MTGAPLPPAHLGQPPLHLAVSKGAPTAPGAAVFEACRDDDVDDVLDLFVEGQPFRLPRQALCRLPGGLRQLVSKAPQDPVGALPLATGRQGFGHLAHFLTSGTFAVGLSPNDWDALQTTVDQLGVELSVDEHRRQRIESLVQSSNQLFVARYVERAEIALASAEWLCGTRRMHRAFVVYLEDQARKQPHSAWLQFHAAMALATAMPTAEATTRRLHQARDLLWRAVQTVGRGHILDSLIALQGNQVTAAWAAAQRAVDLLPECFYAVRTFAGVLAKRERYAAAQAAFEKALMMRPEDVFCQQWRAVMALCQNNYVVALGALDQAIEQRRDDIRLHSLRSAALQGLDDPSGAIAALQPAMDIDPDDLAATRQWADLLSETPQPSVPRERFLICLARHPQDGQLQMFYGKWLQRQGHFDEAIAHFDRAKALLPAESTEWQAANRMRDEALRHAQPTRCSSPVDYARAALAAFLADGPVGRNLGVTHA